LPFDPAYSFALETYSFYQSIIPFAVASLGSELEPGLGGKLFYAGELDQQGRVLVAASNIAGAASLSASADSTVQKEAIRDGVADFLVHSLDEGLRILKNEIRKHNAVAVCVAAAPSAIEIKMLERGVQADLVRDDVVAGRAGPMADRQLVFWSVESSPARWLPKLDGIAMECIPPEDLPARRWLRLAPRYLGRVARGVRILCGDREFASRFVEQVRQRVRNGEIGAEVRIQVGRGSDAVEYRILQQSSSTP
jgi:urocanate hydratase